MLPFKGCLHEVREAALEHLVAQHGDSVEHSSQHLHREEALTTIAMAAIRLLEKELMKPDDATDDHDGNIELLSHLKMCRKALKSHRRDPRNTSNDTVHKKRQRRVDERADSTSSPPLSSGATEQPVNAKSVQLGQYATSDVFDQDEQKRLKFARLMGGAKTSQQAASQSGSIARHNTFAASTAEVKHMNANLEAQFESAMSHKGKKGLGA